MDAITHIKDLSAFRVEAQALAESPDKRVMPLEDGGVHFVPGKIPVRYLGNESICLVRLPNENYVDDIESMCILGKCINNRYEFNNDADRLTYERIRGPLEYTYTDENGETQTGKHPYMIGVIA